MTSHMIGFPGLGIDMFEVKQEAFNLFGRSVAWYGIFISVGILLAVLYATWRAKSEGIKGEDIIDLAIFCIPPAIIGARLYYVVFNLDSYKTFMDVIAIWNGGLAIYGGIIGGFLTAIIVCKVKKISMFKVFDICSPAFLIGQTIGRWGNFMNAEAFGSETALPWRMALGNVGSSSFIEVHPTFLYESLWNLLGFIFISLVYRRKKFDGQIFLMYITWYGFGRMLIEGLRTDSLYIGDFRVSQLLAGLCFIVGSVLLVVFFSKAAKIRASQDSYSAVFNTGDAQSEIPEEASETTDEASDNDGGTDGNSESADGSPGEADGSGNDGSDGGDGDGSDN